VLHREILQLLLEREMLAYFMDFWNIIDWLAVICFLWGFYVYHAPSYSDPTSWLGSYLNEAVFATSETSPFAWRFHVGELCYSLSIFCMYLKLLRTFALFERLNTVVKIILEMTIDIAYWIVVYVLFPPDCLCAPFPPRTLSLGPCSQPSTQTKVRVSDPKI